MFALLESGAIPNVMSIAMVEKLNLKLKHAQRSIKVANGTTSACSGVAEQVPIRFGDIIIHLDFLVLSGAQYHIIIGSPALTRLRTRIDMYRQRVKIRHRGETERINREYEHDGEPDSDELFAPKSENDSSDTEEESEEEIVFTLSDAYLKPRKLKLYKARTEFADSGWKQNIELDDLVYLKKSLRLYQGTDLDFVEQLQQY